MTGEFTSGPADGMQRAIHDAIRTMGGATIQPELEVDVASAFHAGERHLDPLEDFEPYRDEVATIEHLMHGGRPARTIPGYVNEGGEVGVFRVGSDGLRVAKIILPGWSEPGAEVGALIQAFLAGRGAPGLAQIRSFSESAPSAIIVGYVQGDTLEKPETRDRISIEAYRYLIRTIYPEMQRRGLAADNGDYSNTLLTPQGSLEVVDYDYNPDESLLGKILSFGSKYCLLEGDDRPSCPVPPYARRYREACYLEYGEELAQRLDSMWRSYGLEVPDES
jgi:hypothetical protein